MIDTIDRRIQLPQKYMLVSCVSIFFLFFLLKLNSYLSYNQRTRIHFFVVVSSIEWLAIDLELGICGNSWWHFIVGNAPIIANSIRNSTHKKTNKLLIKLIFDQKYYTTKNDESAQIYNQYYWILLLSLFFFRCSI